ncbi:MAG: hypothetical protein EA352_08465 [Gemmatimonadales bacterium]|nr:MAG: hypothetical protein EA352_08465 [Gemmatimonadales bacterium]
MSGAGRPEETPNPYDGTREEMDRAIRRLDVLEWLILLMAVGLAVLGGAAVAFLLSAGTDLAFRPLWALTSILLLAVPGGIVWIQTRRSRRSNRRDR